ncbi:T9SS type A sorting domain-containing protein [bacterium]|nr:T9SS type A sorting domain-containing protein [bacterium]
MKTIRTAILLTLFLTLLFSSFTFAQPAPTLLQEWDGFAATRYAVDGNYAWGIVFDGNPYGYALYRLDLSSDADGELVLDLGTTSCFGLAAEDGVLVLAMGDEGLYILNITDPDNPVWLTTLRMPGNSFDVVLHDSYAYVASSYSGVVTVDIRDPANPTITNYYMAPDAAEVNDILLDEGDLFAASADYGLIAFSLADPAHPAVAEMLLIPDITGSIDLAISRPWICITEMRQFGYDSEYYLRIIPRHGTHLDEPLVHDLGTASEGDFGEVELDSSLAFVTVDDQFFILDITHPEELDTLYSESMWNMRYLQFTDDLLYSGGYHTFRAYSISEGDGPASPAFPQSNTHTPVQPIQAAAPFSLKPAGPDRQLVDDWTLTEIARIQLGSDIQIKDLVLHGSTVYAAIQEMDNQRRIAILDLADPNEPVQVGSIAEPNHDFASMTISGSTMIVADGGTLKLFDLTDPVDPDYLGSVAPGNTLVSIVAVDDLLYGLNSASSLYTYDISDPFTPVLLQFLNEAGEHLCISPDGAWLATLDEYLYGADESRTRYHLLSTVVTGDQPYLAKRWEGMNSSEGFTYRSFSITSGFLYSGLSIGNLGLSQATNLSEPFYPTIPLDLFETENIPGGAVQHEDLLVLEFGNLRMYDVSDPATPELLNEMPNVPIGPLVLDYPYVYAAGGNEVAVYMLELTAIGDKPNPSGIQPPAFCLDPAYPNPFNPVTTITVTLPQRAALMVQVFDIQGRTVATLADGSFAAGTHALTVDGSTLASGLYFVRATVPGQLNQIRKMTLLK